MSRNYAARIVKLEAKTTRPNELLVIWRKPGTDIRTAIASEQFASGNKVICLEWHVNGKPPAPKWHRDLLRSSMTGLEYECLMKTLQRMAEAGENDREAGGFAPFPNMSEEIMRAMPDNELIHAVLGVQT